MRKILIVIDMQNDFIDAALGTQEAVGIVEAVKEKIRSYPAADVIATMDTHGDNYMNTQEGRNLPVPHCIKDSEGFALDSVLAPHLEGCRAFEKPTFGSMDLAEYIRDNASEYASIELCGLVSNICVISNAVIAKAAAPEAEIIVDSKLTASFDPALHDAALAVLGGIQVKVI